MDQTVEHLIEKVVELSGVAGKHMEASRRFGVKLDRIANRIDDLEEENAELKDIINLFDQVRADANSVADQFTNCRKMYEKSTAQIWGRLSGAIGRLQNRILLAKKKIDELTELPF